MWEYKIQPKTNGLLRPFGNKFTKWPIHTIKKGLCSKLLQENTCNLEIITGH